MSTETTTTTAPDTSAAEKINQLRDLFADAPRVGRNALENVLRRLAPDASQKPPPPVQSARRVGSVPSLSALRWLAEPAVPGIGESS